jgi:hypothetical protein
MKEWQMFTVNKNQVDLINGKLVGEASTMGIPPGEVPDWIAVLDDQNEGFLFGFPVVDIHNEEVTGWNYHTNNGLQMLVIND